MIVYVQARAYVGNCRSIFTLWKVFVVEIQSDTIRRYPVKFLYGELIMADAPRPL